MTIAGVPYGCAMWDTGVGSFSSSRPPGDAGACHVALSFDRAVDGRAAHAEQVGDLGGAVLAAVHQGDQVSLLATFMPSRVRSRIRSGCAPGRA